MSSLNRFVFALLAGLGLAFGTPAAVQGASDDGTRPEPPRNSDGFSPSEPSSPSLLLALQVPKLEPTPPSGSAPDAAEPAKTDDQVQKTDDQTPAPAPKALSDAERISRLQKSIEESKKELADLQTQIDDPEGEYPKAEAEFRQLDDKLSKLKESLKDASGDDAARIQEQINSTQKGWQLAKDRFDLAIEQRKTLKEQAAAIDKKIQQDQLALDKLTGVAPVATPNATVPGTPNASAMPNATVPEAVPNTTATPNAPAVPNTTAAPAAAASPNTTAAPAAAASPNTTAAPAAAASPNASAMPGVPGMTPNATAPASAEQKPPSKELVKAKEEVQKKAVEAQQAQQEAESVSDRLATLDENIALEKKHLRNAQKQADNASDARALLADEFEKLSLQEGIDPAKKKAELHDLARRVREADTRYADARKELRTQTERLGDLQAERAQLLQLQLETAQKVEAARKKAQEAAKKVAQLENPFAPMNMLRWVVEHGPNILAILVAMILLHWISKVFSRRVVKIMATSGIRGSKEEREDRANTLVGVFHNAVSVTIWIGGSLMLLQESGVPIAPLLGGAAVFGLAVAFGAQNLIRDYFYGFVVLLENQYKINDVVKIGDDAGQVERITLRMTVLRDLEGNVHFIPNGQITSVINMTHGWSRALFEIGVAYKEDTDRVVELIMELGREIRQDSKFKLMILDDLEMLGVDALGDSAVVIKFFIKTRTLKQWNVKREMLRRIKKKFDEVGIEIPFPHRTLYHHFENGELPPQEQQSRQAEGGGHPLLRGQHQPSN